MPQAAGLCTVVCEHIRFQKECVAVGSAAITALLSHCSFSPFIRKQEVFIAADTLVMTAEQFMCSLCCCTLKLQKLTFIY